MTRKIRNTSLAALTVLALGVLYGIGAPPVHAAPAMPKPMTAQKPAKAAPAVAFTDASGARHTLASYKGHYVLLNMWATWCPPCQREMPALSRAQGLHPKVSFVFVNQGESLDVVSRYLRLVPFHLDHVLVDEGNLLGKAMDSTALPMTLIYGANGQLVYSHQGLISEAVLAMQLERCCESH